MLSLYGGWVSTLLIYDYITKERNNFLCIISLTLPANENNIKSISVSNVSSATEWKIDIFLLIPTQNLCRFVTGLSLDQCPLGIHMFIWKAQNYITRTKNNMHLLNKT